MKINNIINVIDTERSCNNDHLGPIIEIGLTTVDLKNRKILKTYSFPISDARETIIDSSGLVQMVEVEITPYCHQLTGWTTKKLKKQGKPFVEVLRILQTKHGFNGRLCVVDSDNELPFTPKGSPPILNVSTIVALMTGKTQKGISLEKKLSLFGQKFIGEKHRASCDSYNIARLFLSIMDSMQLIME